MLIKPGTLPTKKLYICQDGVTVNNLTLEKQ